MSSPQATPTTRSCSGGSRAAAATSASSPSSTSRGARRWRSSPAASGRSTRAAPCWPRIQAFGPPSADTIGPSTYLDLQAITNPGNPPGRRNYWRSELLADLTDEAIDTLVACAVAATSPASVLVMGPTGGAVADVPENATPISGRSAPWLYHCYGTWTDGDDARHVGGVRATARAMQPFTRPGIAMNFVSDVTADRVRRTYGAGKYHRLQALKAEHDPGNLFRLNHNVPPPPARGIGVIHREHRARQRLEWADARLRIDPA